MGQAREQMDRKLRERGVRFTAIEHAPVHTIEDMAQAGVLDRVTVPKNVFVRDARGRRHILILLRCDKTLDMQAVREALGATRLSFASDERLMKYLGTTPGAVSPLGILNDAEADVEVAVDRDLMREEWLGVHPCENTATYIIRREDLLRIIRENGNAITEIAIA